MRMIIIIVASLLLPLATGCDKTIHEARGTPTATTPRPYLTA
jgi:hypothetical protein